MICNNCGTAYDSNTALCVSCSNNLSGNSDGFSDNTNNAYGSHQRRIPGRGLGLAGMITGISSSVFFAVGYFSLPTVFVGALMSVWGIGLILIAVVLALFVFLSLLCSIAGIILSTIALKKARKAASKNQMAITGMICSVVGMTFDLLYLAFVICFFFIPSI